MRRSMLLALAATASAMPLACLQPASARDYAFVDVNVVPMDREVVLRHRTVFVAAGRIVRIEASRSFRVPRNVTVISGKGRFLLPGLADMHQHFLRSPVAGRKAELVFEDADEK